MVVEQEVDIRLKAAVDIIEPPRCCYIFRDLDRRISVFNCIQDAIYLFLSAVINYLA